jgi:hypothetical protein
MFHWNTSFDFMSLVLAGKEGALYFFQKKVERTLESGGEAFVAVASFLAIRYLVWLPIDVLLFVFFDKEEEQNKQTNEID